MKNKITKLFVLLIFLTSATHSFGMRNNNQPHNNQTNNSSTFKKIVDNVVLTTKLISCACILYGFYKVFYTAYQGKKLIENAIAQATNELNKQNKEQNIILKNFYFINLDNQSEIDTFCNQVYGKIKNFWADSDTVFDSYFILTPYKLIKN